MRKINWERVVIVEIVLLFWVIVAWLVFRVW